MSYTKPPREKGTPEAHKHYLRKLYRWLRLNSPKNPLVDDEADAVAWAYKMSFGEDIDA